MLRKFLISTVIASILILLTTLTTATATAAATTLTSTATPTVTTKNLSKAPASAASAARNISATVLQLTKTSVVDKFLNNAADEATTTSLLPLQPPLNVTSTTLASFILNQKHQQHQRQRKQQQRLYLQKQRENRQLHDAETAQKEQQQLKIQEQLLNASASNSKEIKKKNLDAAFVTVKSAVDGITSEPSSTHAYIPFDLDYSDPTEEKAAQKFSARQSTINEVLTNLFPKGFSDIFRFSYAGEQQGYDTPTQAPTRKLRSSPTPFKTTPPASKPVVKEKHDTPENNTFITVSTTVTREVRREVSPGHTEIVVEKIITEPTSPKNGEDFKDGSNSISKDDLLRISRAAREASVLPSLLVSPLCNSSSSSNETKASAPIVILNESNNNDDFVDAPEDDNQIAESQDVMPQIVQAPPAESTNFHVTPTHQYNVRIIHDNNAKNSENSVPGASGKQASPSARSSPSYQTFVEQSKYLQNSLQEAPSRKFLKTFQNPVQSEGNHAPPVAKGKFHYEQGGNPQNYIQTVVPTAQLQPQAAPQYKEQYDGHQYQHLSDKDIYKVEPDKGQSDHTTPPTLVFVTINSPLSQVPQRSSAYSEEAQVIPALPMKSPYEFVSDAMGYAAHVQQLPDHKAEQTEEVPKPSNEGYTFVEVQKSINIHNKLITEKDGRLVEQHETIYPEKKYPDYKGEQQEQQEQHEHQQHLAQEQQHKQQEQRQEHQEKQQPSGDYVNLSENPIHVQQEEDQHESAASVREEQHVSNPAQNLEDFGPIQQSNLIQESHIIEIQQQQLKQDAHYAPQAQNQQQFYAVPQLQQENLQPIQYQQQHQASHYQKQEQQPAVQYQQQQEPQPVQYQQPDQPQAPQYQQQQENEAVQYQQQGQQPSQHLTGESAPAAGPAQAVQIPYALPAVVAYQPPVGQHIAVPYGIPEPMGFPMHIQHFIERPFPVETIVEKPMPYPVEKVVEKVVEKHVPIEVEKIVEKPVEVIVKKYIDRPVAIPIKIPVSLHLPGGPHGPPPYGPPTSLYSSPPFSGGFDHGPNWPQPISGSTFTRVPQSVLKSYYVKMLKKLVPQMQQAYYKASHIGKGVPKITQKINAKPKFKISDMLYDLKPPPFRSVPVSGPSLGPSASPTAISSWDVGARYQYDYNTLPIDLSPSSSVAMSKSYERPVQGYKTNFDEFQRWRNGHSLKRSPDFGRNLHMEYGFKPPLVPSVEIDDKGVPLKAVADEKKE